MTDLLWRKRGERNKLETIRVNLLFILVPIFLLQCTINTVGTEKGILYKGDGKIICPSSEKNRRNTEADIIKLNNGSLLLAYTKFKGHKDHDNAFIAGKISFNGGDSWSNDFVLQENIGSLNTMSPSFVRIDSSLIGLFFSVKDSKSNFQIYFSKSFNEGLTWNRPVKITNKEGYHILNNDRAISLDTGRLLLPSAFTSNIDSSYSSQVIFTYYSDDRGRTWERSPRPIRFKNGPAMEPGITQLKDGSLLMVIRTKFGKICFSRSYDRGVTWTLPYKSDLDSPASPATIKRIPGSEKVLLVWNNNSGDVWSKFSRTPLNTAISEDGGRTWRKNIELERDLDSIYSYTSVTFLDSELLLTYYHASKKFPNYYNLVFKKVPQEQFGIN